jgi:hypothetical protein
VSRPSCSGLSASLQPSGFLPPDRAPVPIAKIKLGQLGLKTGRLNLAGFQTGRQGIRRAYWQDGKNYRSIRRRCHRCVCGDLRRDGPEGQTGAQMTCWGRRTICQPARPRACFIDVRSIASECFQLGKVTKPGGMNEVIARARFLFDSDIYERLIEMHRLVGQLEVGNETAANRIMDQFEKMLPVFNRYLRMTQRLPSLPWDRTN